MTVAHIRFEVRAIENSQKTTEKGYKCYDDIDFAIMLVPGDRFFEFEQIVTPEVLTRWGNYQETRYRVDAYKAWKAGQAAPLNGTPLKEWPVISPSELRQLEMMHVFTVEDLADLSEEGIRRYGIGAQKLKQKAQSWIAAGQDKGKIVEQVAQQDHIISNMMEQMKAMQEEQAETRRKMAEKDDLIAKLAIEKKGKLKLPESEVAA